MAGGAGVTLGFLKFVLGLDSLAFEKGLSASEKELKAAQKRFDRIGQRFSDFGQTMSLGITAPFTALVATAIPAATESAQALAQVEAAVKSMGGAAGLTVEQLKDMAGQLESSSLADGDDILKSVTANLLTFGNVGKAVFGQAQQAIVDLSARMGTDLQSATLLVGKALNDPLKGMNALARAGIQFSEAQKAQITAFVQSNNLAAAQSMILGELARQFGGAAQAQRDATPNADLVQSWRTFEEVVGKVAIKVLPPLTNLLSRVLNAFNELSPGTQQTVVAIAAVTAAAGPVIVVFGSLVSTIGTILPWILKLGPAFSALSVAFAAVKVAAIAMMPALLPLLPWLAAAAGAVALVYAAWKHWPEIVGFVKRVYEGVKTWIVDKLGAVWNWLKGKIDDAIGWFKGLYVAVVGNSYIPDMVDGIGAQMKRLDTLMVGQAKTATTKTKALFADMADEAQAAIERLLQNGAGSFTRQRTAPEQLDLDAINDEVTAWALSLPDVLETPAQRSTARVAESFAEMSQLVMGSVRGLADDLKNGDWLDVVQSTLDLVLSVIDAVSIFNGKPPRTSSGDFGGFRAMGGPVVPGKSYIVGENGPEWMTPGARGFVTPMNDNGAGGGGMRLQVVPSKYFDVVVDQRAGAVAQPMVARGMVATAMGTQAAMARRQERRLA